MKRENSSLPFRVVPKESAQKDGDPLTYAVIGAGMRVHSELGPGLDESFYHKRLSSLLTAGEVAHQSKARGELFHRGHRADVFECDLLVEAGAIAELKVLAGPETFASEHLAQIICYLKFWGLKTGLLLDFGKERLVYRRIIFTNERQFSTEVIPLIPSGTADFGTALQKAREAITHVYDTHGLGYRDTTYRGLVEADLKADNIFFALDPVANILQPGNASLGNATFKSFVIENSIALIVLALRNGICTADRAVMQTYLKHLGLQAGLIANFGKKRLDVMFVNHSRAS